MTKVELLGYKISRMELLNGLEESGEVRLSDHMEFSVSFEPGEDMAVLELKGKGTFVANAVTSRRLEVHPCRAVTDQPGKYLRYPYRRVGAGKSWIYQTAAGTGRERQNDRHPVHHI